MLKTMSSCRTHVYNYLLAAKDNQSFGRHSLASFQRDLAAKFMVSHYLLSKKAS